MQNIFSVAQVEKIYVIPGLR